MYSAQKLMVLTLTKSKCSLNQSLTLRGGGILVLKVSFKKIIKKKLNLEKMFTSEVQVQLSGQQEIFPLMFLDSLIIRNDRN